MCRGERTLPGRAAQHLEECLPVAFQLAFPYAGQARQLRRRLRAVKQHFPQRAVVENDIRRHAGLLRQRQPQRAQGFPGVLIFPGHRHAAHGGRARCQRSLRGNGSLRNCTVCSLRRRRRRPRG